MATPNTAGYSGTPLAKKLGVKEGSSVVALDAPDGYRDLLAPLPDGVAFAFRVTASTDVVHLFVTQSEELAGQLAVLRQAVAATGCEPPLWHAVFSTDRMAVEESSWSPFWKTGVRP
jgi:hypothetical protein